MLLVNVALGKIHDQADIDGSIVAAPKGLIILYFKKNGICFLFFRYNSIHGNPDLGGGFTDHEYCIYMQDQQYIKYLVEYDEQI